MVNTVLGVDKEDTNLFMKYPYFKDITKLETHVFLSTDAQKVLYKKRLEDFLHTTLRSRLGKPLNKLIDSKYESSYNLGVTIILDGPYNDKLDIYFGSIKLWVQIDSFGREGYQNTYSLANSKTLIQKSVEEDIETLITNFVIEVFNCQFFNDSIYTSFNLKTIRISSINNFLGQAVSRK